MLNFVSKKGLESPNILQVSKCIARPERGTRLYDKHSFVV